MEHVDKLRWMVRWCAENNLVLALEGECGFARECVGILNAVGGGGTYPDYEWHDEDFNREDQNGEVWTPEDAYHKHPCVAVLGRGENAESQLYEWLKWFDDNGFKPELSEKDLSRMDPFQRSIEAMLSGGKVHRMVRHPKEVSE